MKNLIAATLMTMLAISGFYHTYEDSANSDFDRWAKQYGKIYYGDEKIYRQAIYYQNKQMIEEHNKRTDVTYLMGENQFTGITNEEFISLYLHPRPSQTLNEEDQIIPETSHTQPNKEQQIKMEADWRGLVKVRYQGSCVSDYAMAATSVIEGEYAIKKGIHVTLSPQNIIDCMNVVDNGCDPYISDNTVENALQWVGFYGLYTEQQYPYTGKATDCQVDIYWSPYPIGYRWKVESGWWDTEVKRHPITTFVDASKWQFYQSGVFSDCSSKINYQNYYALVVGYSWNEYWIVQPAFGTYWGESGYIRLDASNPCGVTTTNGFSVSLDY